MVNEDGLMKEGRVVQIDVVEHLAQIDNGVQEFWYPQQDLFPIALDETQLLKFGFEKEHVNGTVKYKKDAFRLVTAKPGDFTHVDMWYREDRRHFNVPIAVHELQNLYLSMTKVHLERP